MSKYTLPLFKNDGEAFFVVDHTKAPALERLKQKIATGEYAHEPIACVCGKQADAEDVLLAEKDMWGVPLDTIVCKDCGLIRSKTIFEPQAMQAFYEQEYKSIYYNSTEPNARLFSGQKQRGAGFLSLLQEQQLLDSVARVFDCGCGMGGTLMAFKEQGKQVSGCDFGTAFIAYGQEQGLDLYHGSLDTQKTPPNSQDLVILAHVMEHFSDIETELQQVIEIVAPGKYLLVEVPGLYAKDPYKNYPAWHLQKGHVVNFFYKDFLHNFFSGLGLEVVYGDERCTFICRKPADYQAKRPAELTKGLEGFAERNTSYFVAKQQALQANRFKNTTYISKLLLNMARKTGTKALLHLLIKESRTWKY